VLGIVTTGGTIAGQLLGDVVASAAQEMLPAATWIEESGHGDTFVVRSPLSVMSENLDPGDWVAIAAAVTDLSSQPAIDAILVLHGTDTAAYSSAALSFLCAATQVPVVLTGSNLPASAVGSDAANNIRGAIRAAAALPPGVFLAFSGTSEGSSLVHSGVRVRKQHAGGNPFTSVGSPPVASVSSDGEVSITPFWADLLAKPVSDEGFTTTTSTDLRVVRIPMFPGANQRHLRTYIEQADAQAAVFDLYCSNTASVRTGDLDMASLVRWCTDAGVLVVGIPPEPPHMDLKRYESTQLLVEAGMVVDDRIIAEAAFAKLSCLIPSSDGLDDLRRKFLTPWSYEFVVAPWPGP